VQLHNRVKRLFVAFAQSAKQKRRDPKTAAFQDLVDHMG